VFISKSVKLDEFKIIALSINFMLYFNLNYNILNKNIYIK
jgi:hypothetical protein